MSYAADLVAMVDQRIRLFLSRNRAMGTLATKATTGSEGTALIDGAETATSVKVPGSVFCQPGDRVCLDRYGSDWVVTNAFTGPGFGEALRYVDGLPSATGTAPTGAFSDLVEFGTLTFTKVYDATFVAAVVQAGAYSSATLTEAGFAVRFTPIDGGDGYTPTDWGVTSLYFNNSGQHLSVTGQRRLTGIPAGTYTVSLRWRRVAGTGNLAADDRDTFSVGLDERVRQLTPIL